MRIGCCVNMLSSEPGGTGAQFAEKLAGFGYDYLELPLTEVTALSDGDFAALVKRVEASGIRCEALNNFFPKTLRLTGPDADHAAALEYVRRALARANTLGASYVVFGSGGAKNVPDGFPMEEGFRQLADLLPRMADIARENSVVIAIEPLRRAECNIINDFAEGVRLAKAAGDKDVAVLVDYYHLAEENGTTDSLLSDGREWLCHTHFARQEGRAFPVGMDEDSRYAAYFDALEMIGYDARISLEAYTKDFDKEAPVSLRFFRDRFPK